LLKGSPEKKFILMKLRGAKGCYRRERRRMERLL
jgi:hypothetical protein